MARQAEKRLQQRMTEVADLKRTKTDVEDQRLLHLEETIMIAAAAIIEAQWQARY